MRDQSATPQAAASSWNAVPGLARELLRCFQDEQLILHQILCSGGVSFAEDPGVDGKSLDPSHNVCTFPSTFFGRGNHKLAIQEGLGL